MSENQYKQLRSIIDLDRLQRQTYYVYICSPHDESKPQVCKYLHGKQTIEHDLTDLKENQTSRKEKLNNIKISTEVLGSRLKTIEERIRNQNLDQRKLSRI